MWSKKLLKKENDSTVEGIAIAVVYGDRGVGGAAHLRYVHSLTRAQKDNSRRSYFGSDGETISKGNEGSPVI